MSESGVITLAVTVASAIVWAVRVEGIVRSHEKEIAQLRTDMNSKIDGVAEDVKYVRDRLDELLKRGAKL